MRPSPLVEVMGEETASLLPTIQHLHCATSPRQFEGQVTVTVGKGLARLAARLAGFPPPMQFAAFALKISPTRQGETWTRFFAGHKTVSTLCAKQGQLFERFGPITTILRPHLQDDGNIRFHTGRAWFLGVPLPTFLSPRGEVSVETQNDRYVFDITGDLPLTGRIVRYRGWLMSNDT